MSFYVLEAPKSGESDAETLCLDADGTKMGAGPQCPICGVAIGSRRALPPRRVEIALGGKRFGDFGFGLGTDLLVTERFRNAFLRSGLTGFSHFTPAEIVEVIARSGNIPNSIPNYFIAEPARSRAIINDRACGLEYSQPWTCKECKSGIMIRLRRLVLEPGSWSGEDIFIARGLYGRIITSQRFKEFCDREAFNNCVLVDAHHFHFDYMPGYHAPSTARR